MRTCALLCALFACAGSIHAAESDGWEQIADKEGIKVYRRSVAGSRLKSMRGVGIVDAPVRLVALVLLDDPRAHEWVDSLAESRVVRTLSPYEYVEYNHVAMPAFVRDREFVTRVSLALSRPLATAYIRSVPSDDESIKHTKIIRGTLAGYYALTAIDGGKRTMLTIELHSDPAGLLPAWLVNWFQKDWARATIVGIRRQTKKADLKTPPEFAQFLDQLDFQPR
jgi:START domain-containing protein